MLKCGDSVSKMDEMNSPHFVECHDACNPTHSNYDKFDLATVVFTGEAVSGSSISSKYLIGSM